MKSQKEKYEKVCTDAGVQFVDSDGQFVFFLDTITKQTLSVKKEEFSNPIVQAVVTVHRRKYPKHISLHADIADAIRFLSKKYYTIPPRVISDSALAATVEIQKFITEQEQNNAN